MNSIKNCKATVIIKSTDVTIAASFSFFALINTLLFLDPEEIRPEVINNIRDIAAKNKLRSSKVNGNIINV